MRANRRIHWIRIPALLVTLWVGFISGSVHGQITNQLGVGSLTRGEVNQVGQNFIVIDGKKYELAQSVGIEDSLHNGRDLKDVEVGGPIAYHLSQGRIDHLVIILPR